MKEKQKTGHARIYRPELGKLISPPPPRPQAQLRLNAKSPTLMTCWAVLIGPQGDSDPRKGKNKVGKPPATLDIVILLACRRSGHSRTPRGDREFSDALARHQESSWEYKPDRAQVHETVSMLRDSMPGIAGVANAAMILEDSLFLNTTAATVEKQLKPKVAGTIHLDEEFAQKSLDFFVLFSSLASECGNPGQFIYHAANMFMTSLVARRRHSGLSASVIHIGMIVDVGYVAKSQRTNINIEHHLRSLFCAPLAETDFHRLFAGAILSGHLDSGNAELSMGIQPFIGDPSASTRPPWYNNPRFSHMIVPLNSTDGSQSSTSTQQYGNRLEDMSSIAEAVEIFQDLFSKKIESMMKASVVSLDVKAPLSDLGLDSFLAVEIRTWLLQVMKVDVPLLRILGRESMVSISTRAAHRYVEEMPVKKNEQITALPMQIEPEVDLDISQNSSESAKSAPSSGTTKPSECACANEPEYTRTECTSFPQASLHFLHNFLDDQTMFNITTEYNIKGQLNVSRFARALEKTLARHEAFQTCFFTEPGSTELRRGIVSNISLKGRFTHIKVSAAEDVEQKFQAFAGHHWELANGQTFKAMLFTHSPETHTVIFGCHHIIMGGMSWHIFLRDLDLAYQMSPFTTNPNSYLDFSRQQIDALQSGEFEESIEYWTQEQTATSCVRNHIVRKELDANIVDKIKDVSKAYRVTIMQFYLAIVQALFARLLELDEICIGVTDAGRITTGSFTETIGHFSNLLSMRFYINRQRPFAEVVQDTSRTVLNGLSHAQVPIDILLKRLGMKRSSVYAPLFQIAFNYRIGDLLQTKLGNCSMDFTRYLDAKTPYDLTFNVTQTSQRGHLIEVSSNAHLYSIAATELVLDSYISLLEILSVESSQKLQDCKLSSHAQPALLGRGPRVQYLWLETLSERFHQICSAFPDKVSIKDGQGFATYAQFASRVNATAAALVEAGVCPAASVAILLYVPLDPTLPVARQRTMMEACKLDLLLFYNATAGVVTQHDNGVPIPRLNLSELLLFTSGSTGTPKGIRLTQSGIMNYAAAKSAIFALGQVKVLQQSSTGFDMSIVQAFNAFANAGTLVIAPSQFRGDPVKIADLMLEESIYCTICTPIEYLTLTTYSAGSLRKCTSWRYACSGGEAIVDGLVTAFRQLELPNITLTDCYGPTEVSCAVTLQFLLIQASIERNDALYSLGKAIPNTSVYILDSNCEPLPPGFPGEICVGGRGVAGDYLNTEISSTKFVYDPFATPEDVSKGWNRIYRTGDKGYLLEDGSLVFLGRIDGDTLVKLRGFRIELNEVANAILGAAQGSLADAVVTLCVGLPLPRYMLPSMIIPLDRLPATINGKVDRKTVATLPLPEVSRMTSNEGRLTVAEGELRIIWRDVSDKAAGATSIKADTDFFTTGGSSLLLVRLQSALKKRMGVRIALHELYRTSTLRAMADATSEERSQLVTESIDWKAETSIDPNPDHDLRAGTHNTASSSPQQTQRQVVLTGATGFLGSEILAALIGDEDVANIHCIAVPTDTRDKLPENPKVLVYQGSLLSPNLGLSKREMAVLKRTWIR
ncbi:hypothetical protein G7Y89_g8391 [Cudoniella acicularis]|uniref:Carrier domain-containing protein n=1 Tax=Cudoniella acicularis TaxID=354080 RepID=A0A8H4RJF8_9HELO|nr:hypothetical protein G7Y89_g8391 [Cudoniella acicularis]